MDLVYLYYPKKQNKITSVDEWSSAFAIFMSIYSEKYPNQVPSLIKYGETIKDIAKVGGDFISYDEGFRYHRKSNPSSWDQFNPELYTKCTTVVRNSSNRVFMDSSDHRMVKPSNFLVPRGFCYTYHRGLHEGTTMSI